MDNIITVYSPARGEEQITKFGETHWEKIDLEHALEFLGEEPSEENILETFNNIDEEELIEAMVEAGWDYIYRVIYQTLHGGETK